MFDRSKAPRLQVAHPALWPALRRPQALRLNARRAGRHRKDESLAQRGEVLPRDRRRAQRGEHSDQHRPWHQVAPYPGSAHSGALEVIVIQSGATGSTIRLGLNLERKAQKGIFTPWTETAFFFAPPPGRGDFIPNTTGEQLNKAST